MLVPAVGAVLVTAVGQCWYRQWGSAGTGTGAVLVPAVGAVLVTALGQCWYRHWGSAGTGSGGSAGTGSGAVLVPALGQCWYRHLGQCHEQHRIAEISGIEHDRLKRTCGALS